MTIDNRLRHFSGETNPYHPEELPKRLRAEESSMIPTGNGTFAEADSPLRNLHSRIPEVWYCGLTAIPEGK